MFFKHLRESTWNPTFIWMKSSIGAACQINSFHEDYPKYVGPTTAILRVLNETKIGSQITISWLLAIHSLIFHDQPFTERWRDINVTVGPHYPPSFKMVERYMLELESVYVITDIDKLAEWYWDFETIHPFQDGNGRVGGVVVAAYSHSLHPDKGWLTTEQ